VRAVVEGELHKPGLGLKQLSVDCFSPAAPVPERRIPKAG
jgi:hypothetical protein